MNRLDPIERIDGGHDLAVRVALSDAVSAADVVVMETQGSQCVVELDEDRNVVALRVQGPGARRLMRAMEDAA